MNENSESVKINIIEFNRHLSLLINKRELDEYFYKFCILKIKKYVIKMFGNQVPVENTAYDVFHSRIFTCKTVPVVVSSSRWLWTATKNFVIDEIKYNKKFKQYIDNINYDRYYEDMIEREDMKAALKFLDEQQLQVIVLHYFSGFKYSEIANILNINEANARQISHRAKNILKKHLE